MPAALAKLACAFLCEVTAGFLDGSVDCRAGSSVSNLATGNPGILSKPQHFFVFFVFFWKHNYNLLKQQVLFPFERGGGKHLSVENPHVID